MEKKGITSRLWRLENLYYIVDKDSQVVKFKLNKWQKMLYDKENEMRKEGRKVWLKILKARQIGFTTYKYIDKLDKALFYSNTNVNIVAHNREKLQDIFKKVKFTYENVPQKILMGDWRTWIKPKPKYDNANEYYFPQNNSTIKVTLDSRSGTLSDCHISEWAFIDEFRSMLRATLPSAEKADITVETTANGMNEFKQFWDEDDRFEPIFFPRFTDDSYREKAPDGYYPMAELEHIYRKFNLDLDQMYWYETRYKNDTQGCLQEYPSEPIDAFISSGYTFYNLKKINEYPILEWESDEFYPPTKKTEGLVWYNRNKTKNAMYGIDLAEWLTDGDYSVIRVRDRNLNLIATYRGTADPADIAKIVNYLWQNGIEGIIAPERNNHGHTFINAAKAYIWYNKIYIPKNNSNDDSRELNGQRGWLTNLVTRPLMLDEHKELIKDGLMQMDKALRDECYTFIIKNSKPQADTNCHDDIIMADAICCQMLKTPVFSDQKYTDIISVSYNDDLY